MTSATTSAAAPSSWVPIAPTTSAPSPGVNRWLGCVFLHLNNFPLEFSIVELSNSVLDIFSVFKFRVARSIAINLSKYNLSTFSTKIFQVLPTRTLWQASDNNAKISFICRSTFPPAVFSRSASVVPSALWLGKLNLDPPPKKVSPISFIYSILGVPWMIKFHKPVPRRAPREPNIYNPPILVKQIIQIPLCGVICQITYVQFRRRHLVSFKPPRSPPSSLVKRPMQQPQVNH
mmetsp:Transcript_34552/g.55192  ORF Transcript_34552/g.55192 Transcript_34552/m.55192 type:complete len:233 (+) Transcript_34552:169-867(+)